MTNRMRVVLLVVNVLAGIGFALGFLYLSWMVPRQTRSRVAALDRIAAVNVAKLKEFYPDLAENVREELGPWIAKDEHAAGIRAAQTALVVALVNVLILYLAGRLATRRQQAQPAPSETPPGAG